MVNIVKGWKKLSMPRFFKNTLVSTVCTWCLYCMFVFGSYWTRKEGKRVSLVNTWLWQSSTCFYWNSGKKPIATARRFMQVLVQLLLTGSWQTYALMIFSVKKKFGINLWFCFPILMHLAASMIILFRRAHLKDYQ